ncbi:MAG: FtsX-like permease family protein, partial [Cyclobacteriaceae bacterium]
RKRKEVGIRKVLGASEWAIALILSRDFMKIIANSIFIGAHLSFFANNLWLQKFPNRVDFGVGTIFLGALVLLMLGLITIGSQTLTASKRNPVDVLKTE